MPPAGILQTEMDEDAVIEIEIQQELEGINLDENDELDLDNIEHEHIYGSDDDEDFCDPVKEPVNTNEEVLQTYITRERECVCVSVSVCVQILAFMKSISFPPDVIFLFGYI